jgi:hypothetical protein
MGMVVEGDDEYAFMTGEAAAGKHPAAEPAVSESVGMQAQPRPFILRPLLRRQSGALPRSHGRIRYPPSSHKGLPGQNFCASLMAAASGARFCGAATPAPSRGLWTVLPACAIDTAPKVSSVMNTSTVSLRRSVFAMGRL